MHCNITPVVSCAPGSYNGLPQISMTDIGDGQYIEEVMPQCTQCPLSTYQANKGSTECERCPEYTSTLSGGTSSLNQCIGRSIF